jgi:hypothetical protein
MDISGSTGILPASCLWEVTARQRGGGPVTPSRNALRLESSGNAERADGMESRRCDQRIGQPFSCTELRLAAAGMDQTVNGDARRARQ